MANFPVAMFMGFNSITLHFTIFHHFFLQLIPSTGIYRGNNTSGEVEMDTGIHDGMSAADYFALPAANKSGLDDLEKSPLHFFARNLDPNREPRNETPAMRLGTAIHTAILEPERFAAEYRRVPMPEEHPAALVSAEDYKARCKALGLTVSGTKEAMKSRILEFPGHNTEFFEDILDAASALKLLSPSDFKTVAAIQKNVAESTIVREILGAGKSERVMIWRDAATGELCKGRADWIPNDLSIIVDLKSSQDASPEGFAKSVATYNYHRQAAWYVDGLRAVSGNSAEPLFVFIVYETAAPYACAFYFATPGLIEQGRVENARLLAKYAECKRAGAWPGYAEEIIGIELPKWKQQKELTV
jgi:hypothetical protein